MAKAGRLQLQDVLKDYWVGQKLGTGARTEIYEVKRRKDGQAFAVKFVGAAMEEDLRVIGHLENEFQVLQALHAQKSEAGDIIIRAVEFQKVKQRFKVRAAYLVMEYARGRSLFEHGDYDLHEVLTIFQQVGRALEHMHQVGYVHADLKPQNILVGDDLKVKLIDFGFAAPIGHELGSSKGTFGYLAPEQAGGRLSEKTDVFNLGAALYKILTGRNLPSIMPGRHEARGFVPDQQVNITPPSRLNPKIPRELSDMVLKCISADGLERPTVRDLRRYLYGLQLRLEYGTV